MKDNDCPWVAYFSFGLFFGVMVMAAIVLGAMVFNPKTPVISYEDGSKVICYDKHMVAVYDPEDTVWYTPAEDFPLNVCEGK